VLVDPSGDEARELGLRLVQDAERGVARLGQILGRLQHPVEHHVEVELAEHAAGHLENALRCPVHVIVVLTSSRRAFAWFGSIEPRPVPGLGVLERGEQSQLVHQKARGGICCEP